MITTRDENGSVYVELELADGHKRAAGYQVQGDRQAAVNQCARDLGQWVEHAIRTGEWL
jgi:hypothetical protein